MIAPSLDIVLDWLHSGAIAPDPRLPKDPEKDRRAREMWACFRQYPEVLDTLLRATLFRPPVDHKLESGAAYRQHAQLREGQNQMAAFIIDYIDHAKALERTPTHEHEHSEPDASGAFEPAGVSGRAREPDADTSAIGSLWPTDNPGNAVA